MYLSAERLAVANRAVRETFEQTSVAWQAIPHWDTGDPGQTWVRSDTIPPGFLEVDTVNEKFAVTLAQAGAPLADPLLAVLMKTTVELAATIDTAVLAKLQAADPTPLQTAGTTQDLLNTLVDARAKVETAGYRAPSCLFTGADGLKRLNHIESGEDIAEAVLKAGGVTSLYRVDETGMLMLGRRQRIAQGAAATASPGEEPVDLAVAVAPSLEVIGENADGAIELAVRIRYALRIKDPGGVVGITF
ncbi:hypothetical protein [Mycolicibacterium brisbanense]|uniref:Phage major capsid protein n=1 Tax=Mycolicibacterium brisbanense TaxID=146020 RepID=A0A100VYW1_9MYCO|nr:hypothetical protein [Mycolicibacterium brisbanense]MCV7158677.1 hypothetical protein [Mycolicibacterium brisbanense]GAS88525.1 uncharacterized protein RMCB_2621 [Mycolicibacterium brisbanense]